MLEAQNITKRFGGLVAVSQASLKVAAGSIVALIGPNGAGKTTLFAAMTGFHRPDSGSVTFDGADITGLMPHAIARRGLVRTFQIVQPFGALSVRENIAVGAHLREPDRQTALARAGEIATRLGMGSMLDQPAATLTVAGRKRLEVARALATSPKLILLDEVMAGLNPTEIDEIVPIIRAVRDAGTTVLLIEHVMRAVMRLSERVYVLNQGRMIAEGTPQEVAARPEVVEAYLGHGAAQRIAGASA
ncbi:MAG: ABC transporter ATP-binding protein [Magnetospirillum sp.]|nr:ABC transporter ATP-binding protein [Magnetospirillum sp.]